MTKKKEGEHHKEERNYNIYGRGSRSTHIKKEAVVSDIGKMEEEEKWGVTRGGKSERAREYMKAEIIIM